MTTTAETTAAKPGWLFWLVAVISLVWNGFGAVDYTMSHTMRDEWFRMMGMTDAQMAYFASYPTWMHAVWAIGVWGSVIGSILLLLRSRHAATAFLLSLIGALASFVAQFTMQKPASLEGGAAVVMPVVIMILIVAQWYYARRQAAAGVPSPAR